VVLVSRGAELRATLLELVAELTDDLLARGYAKRTVRLYRENLTMFAEWAAARTNLNSLTDLGRAELLDYQTHLLLIPSKRSGRPRGAGTRNHHTAALRAFFEFLVKSGRLLASPAEVLANSKVSSKLPTVLTVHETLCLLAAPATETVLGSRDRAALEVLYGSGLRAAEFLACDLGDLELTAGYLHVRCGKGGKPRVVPLTEEAVRAVRDYLQHARPRLATGKMGGKSRTLAAHAQALWLSREGTRWSEMSLWEMVKKYARQAKLAKNVSPHLLRHSCATHLLQGEADIRHIQELLGHERLSTTQRYTHLQPADLKAVISRYHPRSRSL
jgi:integrase/recombinase XerD